MSLRKIIEGFSKELEETVKTLEDAISISRKVITLSKQAVMAIHRDRIDEAKNKLEEAANMLKQVETILSPHPDLDINILKIAYQEYAEAKILINVIETELFPGSAELNVPTIPYLLGLADSIGEFRRRALEFLRKGKLTKAERCFQVMDNIYSELVVLENAYSLAPELRHKCDTARHLLEITLGDIATETSRSALEKAIKQLDHRITSVKGEP